MICASQLRRRLYCTSTPTQCAIASSSISAGSETPNSVRSSSAAHTCCLLLQIAFAVDQAQTQARFEKAVEVSFVFDLMIACCDRHFFRSRSMVPDRGHDLLLLVRVE